MLGDVPEFRHDFIYYCESIASTCNYREYKSMYCFPAVYSAQTGMSAYNWTTSVGGNITAGDGASSVTVVWNTTGVQTVFLTFTNTNGCTNMIPASYGVTVKQGPSPTITGTNNLCVNSGYYNYTTQAGMTGYTWNISSGGIIICGGTTNIVTVNWTASGSQSVSVNYSNSNGCAAPSPTTYSVNVTDLPGPAGSISGPASVCEGGTRLCVYLLQLFLIHILISGHCPQELPS